MGYFCEDISLYRDYIMLNEAYIGKTPILEKIEKKIGEARKKIKLFKDNNTIPEVLEINRLFEKQFGMDLFALKIIQSDEDDCSTHTVSTDMDVILKYDMSSFITADSTNGYRFKKDNNLYVEVKATTGFLLNPMYTDAEIVAVLLHEIGHNFADCIYDKIEIDNRNIATMYQQSVISYIVFCSVFSVAVPDIRKYLNLLGKRYNAIRFYKEYKNQQSKHILSGFFNGIKAKGGSFKSLIKEILGLLNIEYFINRSKNIKKENKKNKVDVTIRSSIDRQNEVFADKFAGVYGYGVELISGLDKLDKKFYQFDKVETMFTKFDIKYKELIEKYKEECLDVFDFDEHPNTLQRLSSELTLLKNELKKEDIDPKVKESIRKQIDELNNIIQANIAVTKEMSKYEKAIALYNQMIINNCPTPIEKELEDAIETALDAALEKNN